MGHVSVLVPDGHTLQIHPPAAPMAPQGMVADPMMQGAKGAMDQVMPKEPAKPKAKSKKVEAKKEPKKG